MKDLLACNLFIVFKVFINFFEFQVPGLNNFIKMSDTPIHSQSTATWARGLTQEEINSMHQLGNLSTNQLIKEITKVYDEAYKLGVIEAKEISRGKFLGIFQNTKKK
uniref:Uncharacterized protein n=1 Tax=Megaselia scalaris TaxID=36166 RepID=T1GFY4_MEGSC